jgi:hypothetical protein
MTLKPKEISAKEINEILEYRDGKLYWKVGRNGRYPGKETGSLGSGGYLQVRIKYKLYLVHRLVWIMHGKDFAPIIDHINGDKLDNRIENLRTSSQSENSMNRRQRSDNTSGVKGVRKRKNRWYVTVGLNGKNHYGGCFKTKEEACEAVKKLREELHGKFARC